MKLTFKVIAATVLAVSMLFTLMTGVFAAESASAAAVESITVDGVKEDAWDAATEYTLTYEVPGDCTGDAATRGESSEVKFRVAYTSEKIYMLFTIEDDAFINAASETNWKNDSIFLYISEDGQDRTQSSDKSTVMAVYLEEYDESKADRTGFAVRSGKGANNSEKEHKVSIDGTTAIVEISFALNTVTPAAGGSFVLDVQYNDQDSAPTGDNTRTIVWSWSTNAQFGPNPSENRNQWGTINFAEAVTEDGDNTEGGDNTEVPETGDMTVVLAVLALVSLAGAAVIRRRVRN